MKRFRFSLESLLRYRNHLEQQSQLEVARARSHVLACEKRIANYEKDYEKTTQELDTEISTGITANWYKHYTDYLAGIEYDLESEHLRLQELLKLLAEKQKELAQRSMDKKVLENLKNHRREDYYREMAKNLQKETDDTIIVRKVGEMGR